MSPPRTGAAAWAVQEGTRTMARSKHILVVEDEQHLALGIKYNLEAEGYSVSVAADGPSALKLIEDAPAEIDLVVLDLMLPGMSGYAVCESLREEGNDVPVLMLSARTLSEDRIRGFDVGADQYLQKPFDLGELLSRARSLLERRRPKREGRPAKDVGPEFAFGDAVVNFDTFEVHVAAKPLRLTHMELKLLRYFAEHAGIVLSRSELLENVWGTSTSPTTRTVDNFVMRLRKYFEKDPGVPRYFLSVRGAGYRFLSAGEEA